MNPLPEHGRQVHLLSRLVEILLESDARNYEAFTPTPMTVPGQSGIELDWQTDPPPDLVIEVDVTNYTAIAAYLPYRVPEVWLLGNDRLDIYQLQTLPQRSYQLQSQSLYCPNRDLPSIAARLLQNARDLGTGLALQESRQELSQGRP